MAPSKIFQLFPTHSVLGKIHAVPGPDMLGIIKKTLTYIACASEAFCHDI